MLAYDIGVRWRFFFVCKNLSQHNKFLLTFNQLCVIIKKKLYQRKEAHRYEKGYTKFSEMLDMRYDAITCSNGDFLDPACYRIRAFFCFG